MALPPYVNIWLSAAGAPAVDITSYFTQESGATLTSTIENPTQLGTFTAPEVTLMGYDPTGYIKGLLAGMTPLSTNYVLGMTLGVWDPTTGTLQRDVQQVLYIVPNTVQFDTVRNSFQFTAVGMAHLLTTTSADYNPATQMGIAALSRYSMGYSDAKWILQQDVSPLDAYIRVTVNSGYSTRPCDFQSGDQIKLGGNETFTVAGVQSDGANPPVYWTLLLNSTAQNKYAASSTVPVVLQTPYVRNIQLQDLVSILFTAAGIPTMQFFGSAPLPFLSTPFASPVSMTGLPGGALTGMAPILPFTPVQLGVGTPGEVYRAANATSGFTPLAPRVDPPIDPTNSLTKYIYTGQKRVRTRAGSPRWGLNSTMKFYAYDVAQYGGTQNRYILTLTCNADVVTGPYSFTTALTWETYNVGTDTWSAAGTLWGGVADTTATNLAWNQIWNGAGITVDTSGTIFFTDFFVASSGAAISSQISSYQPTGGTPATGTLTRNRASSLNGQMALLAPGVVGVFQLDGLLGSPPRALVYTVTAPGVMTLAATQAVSAYLYPTSIKLNGGDGKFYGLVSDPVTGVTLLRWLNSSLTPDPSYAPVVLLPPPTPSVGTALNAWDVDLCILPTGTPGSGAWPIYINIAGTIYFVSTTGSGVVPYADMTGLAVGDALSQLTLLNAGIFYCAQGYTGWVFRSRSAPDPSATIYTFDQLDAPMTVGGIVYPSPVINLNAQPIYNLWTGYVSISNPNDASIFGDAGDPAYSSGNNPNTANTSSNSLELQCAFITSSSFAKALAQSLYAYLGAQKRTVDVEVQRDGLRVYDVGRTFRLTIPGDTQQRKFQIIQSQTDLFGSTTKITGLEV